MIEIETLAHYRILDRIGAGGLGGVYRARDTRLGRTVAIKVIPETIAGTPAERERFMKDARAAAALSHPNIAALFEIGEDAGRLFLVFEYVPGEPLSAVIAGRPLNVRRAIDFGVQLADALAEAHAAGIVHHDLTPDNIIINPKEHAKILDFGLAAYTRRGAARDMGSDPRADILSLGAVIYEMATGQPPFAAKTGVRESAGPSAPGSLNLSIPAELDAIVARAMAKEEGARYQSAASLAAELRSVGTILDVRTEGVEPPTLVTRPGRAPRGRAMVVAVLAVALLGVAVWMSRDAVARTWRRLLGPAFAPVLAVIPLELDGDDRSRLYYADGLTEDLILRLGQTPGLKVVGRSTTREHRLEDPRDLAEELGAGMVLTGSVRPPGDMVTVSIALLDPVDGSRVWTGDFRRPAQQIFALQTEIAEAVAEELRITLTPDPVRTRTASRRVGPGAYDLYLQGRDALARRDAPRAIALFERALGEDPALAEAQAALAEALHLEVLAYAADDSALRARLSKAAEEAAAIDADLAQVRLAIGLAAPGLAEALAHLRRAIELDPSNAAARRYLGDQIAGFDPSRAIALYRKALELDPRLADSQAGLARAHVDRGPGEDAARAARAGEAIRPGEPHWPRLRALIALHRGRYEEVIGASLPEMPGRYSEVARWLHRARALHASGRIADGVAIASALVQRNPSVCEARAILAGFEQDAGRRAGAARAAAEILAEAEAPIATLGAPRCAATAAAGIGDAQRAAHWLDRIAGGEASLRQWAQEDASEAHAAFRRGWYPWSKVANRQPIIDARKRMDEAYARMRDVIARALDGLS